MVNPLSRQCSVSSLSTPGSPTSVGSMGSRSVSILNRPKTDPIRVVAETLIAIQPGDTSKVKDIVIKLPSIIRNCQFANMGFIEKIAFLFSRIIAIFTHSLFKQNFEDQRLVKPVLNDLHALISSPGSDSASITESAYSDQNVASISNIVKNAKHAWETIDPHTGIEDKAARQEHFEALWDKRMTPTEVEAHIERTNSLPDIHKSLYA